VLAQPELRWGVEQRLAFIETQLFWEGGVNRGDLVTAFDISVPQASKDLALYQQQAGNNLRYDGTKKRYVAADAFTARFAAIDPNAYLTGLINSDGGAPVLPFNGVPAEYLPIPRRPIIAEVLRVIVAAVRERQSLEISYQSIVPERAGAHWRRISPHAFAHDGTRWHVRAFAHERGQFLDFILSRCLAARLSQGTDHLPEQDQSWNTYFPVVLTPNPALSLQQQRVVADDYGMRRGQVTVKIRHALLSYFDKRLRLDLSETLVNPREASVVVKNRTAYERALKEAQPRPD
jgi:WYL domain